MKRFWVFRRKKNGSIIVLHCQIWHRQAHFEFGSRQASFNILRMGLHKGIEFVERILRLSERFERPSFEQMRILVVGVKTYDFLHVGFAR